MGIVVWDITQAPSADAALTAFSQSTYFGLFGSSALFNFTVTTSSTPAPSDFLMSNMQAFNVANFPIIPEPTTFAMAGLAAAMLIFGRRK